MYYYQWRIQDFPEGGREHAKFSRKLHEIERIWTPRGGRASLTPPLDPPMITTCQVNPVSGLTDTDPEQIQTSSLLTRSLTYA